jgi:hypothetical protein
MTVFLCGKNSNGGVLDSKLLDDNYRLIHESLWLFKEWLAYFSTLDLRVEILHLPDYVAKVPTI